MHLGGLLETDCSPRGSDSVALEQLGTSGMCHFSKPTMLLIQGVLGPTLGSNRQSFYLCLQAWTPNLES